MNQFLIHNATLVDGTGASPLGQAAVVVEGNRIRAAGAEQALRPAWPHATLLDARGGFILPGFIDCHVHLVLEDLTIPRLLSTPLSFTLLQATRHMQRTLEAGVTTVRDAGGADLGLKQAVEQGVVVGPRMQISITPLTMTGGHLDYSLPSGNEYHLFPSYPGRPDGRCDGVDEVRRKVREILRAGADVLKVCATGGTMSPNDRPEYSQFSLPELEAITQEAASHGGKKVMAHGQGSEGIKNALRAGVRSIEHGVYLDSEGIDLMLERGAFLVPTLLAPAWVLELQEDTSQLPEWGLRKMREVFEANLESAARAYRAGVRIAMGTDAAVCPHGSNLRELSLLCRIGMSPMEAILAGTRVAAQCLGWDERVGTLEEGKLADLIICRADPLEDIGRLAEEDNILFVMKGGAIVKDRLPACPSS